MSREENHRPRHREKQAMVIRIWNIYVTEQIQIIQSGNRLQSGNIIYYISYIIYYIIYYLLRGPTRKLESDFLLGPVAIGQVVMALK